MSKLLFLYERDMPTVSITREIFEHLENYPEVKSSFIYLSDVKPSDIDSCDVVVLIRPDNIYSWKIAQKARNAGHVVFTLCDDDLLNLPSTAPTIPWRKKGLRRSLSCSDGIWSCSRHILDKYQDLTLGKRIALFDTIIRPDELEDIVIGHSGDEVKVLYAAAPGHAELFEKYVGPIVPNLVSVFGSKISFTFISVHPHFTGGQCEYLAGMPLLEYRNYVKTHHFDIGLAPLYDNEFCKCKYFNKFLEYTTQGIVGVYSRTEPYTNVVKDGETGFLVENSPECWYEALKKVIESKSERTKCVENSIDYLRNNHSEKACMERLIKGLPEIIEDGNGYAECGNFSFQKVKYYLMRPFDLLYLFCFYLRTTGIKAVIKKIKYHYIEAKAYRKRRINSTI